MALTSSILVYGHDTTLLDTRRWVLEKAGFRVGTVSDLPPVTEALAREAHHLVILCHTLTSDERRAAIVTVNGCRPAMKTLSICTDDSAVSGEVLDSFAGAEGLIAAVERMLN